MEDKISFVVACYKSEEWIGSLIDDIRNTVSAKDDYEIICVNDASPDNLKEVLYGIASNDEKVKVITLNSNVGQHFAVICGVRHTSGSIIVNLDDDGQSDPKQCYKLIDKVRKGSDLVFAAYSEKKEHGIKLAGSKINKILFHLLHKTQNWFEISSYFACTSNTAHMMGNYNALYEAVCSGEFIEKLRISNAEVEHFNRIGGTSSYNLRKLTRLFLNEMRVTFGIHAREKKHCEIIDKQNI